MAALLEWMARRGIWQGRGLTVLFGGLVALGQPPFSIFVLTLVGLFLLAAQFLAAKSARAAGWVGWFGGLGYFAGSLYWIVEPFLVDIPRHGWMAPFALLFLAAGLALFWGAGFWLAAKVGATGRIPRLLALIAGLGAMELARSYVLTGFPWGLLAYVWVETPVAQWAAYLGPHGLGAVTLGLAVMPLMGRKMLLGSGVSLAVLAGLYLGGNLRQNTPVPAPPQEVNLRLVQPNATQRLKWQPDQIPIFYNRLLNLSQRPAATTPDLIIWPETAVPFWLDENPEQQKIIGQLAKGQGRVIVGLRRFSGLRTYNSLAVFDQDGVAQAVYDKAHLVPFGEYIPFGNVLARFGLHGLAAEAGGGYSAGKSTELLDLGRFGQALPLICYESIFPDIARDRPQADWILQVTNDAWFGEFAGPFQHLAQARFRAIEQGLPFVRAANTGVSAVLTATGQVVVSLGLGQSGILDAKLPGKLPETLYAKTGDLPWGIVLFGALGGISLIRRRN